MFDPLAKLRDHQDGKCAVCQQVRKLVVDHDHESGLVRGLLCARCNTMEGTKIPYPWMEAYRASSPAMVLGLVVKYGAHHARPDMAAERVGRREPRRSTVESMLVRIAERGIDERLSAIPEEFWPDVFPILAALGDAVMAWEAEALAEKARIAEEIAA